MHGGKQPTGRLNPNYKHGLYATKHIPEVEEKIKAFELAPVDDLGAELALTRALLAQYLESLTNTSARNIEPVNKLIESIRRTVDTISRIRSNTAMTGQEVQLLIQGMSAVLQKYVPAEHLPDAINDIRRIVKHS